jgi:1-acyl-sn-glycerol-3-phosphate acyltransferase
MAQRVRRRWKLGFWYRVAVVILWPFITSTTKRDYRGTEYLEATDGGIVIAPNHLSWFDPIVIAHALWSNDRPPRFMAKESVFRVPIAGRIIDGAGQIRVYRDSRDAARAVRDAVTAVQEGECVVVYPEGTITRDPNLWPMTGKSGAARVALQSGCPLIPMAQWGAQEVIRPYAKELRLFPRKCMRVRFGPPIDLDDLRDRPITSSVLAIATERLMAAITELLEQIRDEEAPKERYVFRRDREESA